MKIVQPIASVVTIVVSIMSLSGKLSEEVALPTMFFCLAIINMFNLYDNYKQKKKISLFYVVVTAVMIIAFIKMIYS